jgi:hypothetical protein
MLTSNLLGLGAYGWAIGSSKFRRLPSATFTDRGTMAGMRFRKLRIAFSVTCLIACALLIVLWVRSYWQADTVIMVSQSSVIGFGSGRGSLAASLSDRVLGYFDQTWYIASDAIGSSRGFGSQYLPGNRKVFGFGITQQPSFTSIYVPCWLCVSFFATLAAAPWIRWRFTLRTLLIATTMVAVVLGLIVYAVRQ